jgi:hypothetical protein
MRFRFIATLSLLFLALNAPSAQQAGHAQAAASYCISAIDASQWPKVSMRFRALNSDGRFVDGLSTVPVFENGQPAEDVQLSQTDGPLAYAILVDGGRAPSRATRQAVQRAIARIAESGAFRNGIDQIHVRVLANTGVTRPSENSEVRIDWTSDASVINTLTRSDFLPTNARQTRGLDAFDRVIRDINDRVGSPANRPAVAVFLSNRVEASTGNAETDAIRWAGLLRDAQIPVYAIQTASTDSAPLKALTGGGAFYAVTSTKSDADVDALFLSMSTQRRFYTATFTSKFTGGEARTITVNSPSVRGSCQDSDSYQFVADQPQFIFDNVPSRLSFDENVDRIKIKVQVAWPRNQPRELTDANLLIDGQRRAQGDVLDRNQLIEFTVLARDVQDKTSAEIKVEATDASGKRFTSQGKQVDIATLKAVAPLPTDTPLAPAPAPQPGLPFGVVAAIAAAALAVGGAGAWFVVQRSKRSAKGGAGLQAQVMASMTVLEGPHGRRNEKILLNKPRYVIGRQGADIVFYADMPKSTVSRTHCTITRDADMSFWLTDNVSSNGTKLNGKPVTPNQRVPINNGDQILLGDINRNGVLLQFSLDHPTQFVKSPAGR